MLHSGKIVYQADSSRSILSDVGTGLLYIGAVVDIFFRELLSILCSLYHITSKPTPPKHILIYSDSLDSVQVLNILRAKESSHNSILLAIPGIILKTGVDLVTVKGSKLLCLLIRVSILH